MNKIGEEIQDYLGIELMMGVLHMPGHSDYWVYDTLYAPIADIMQIHRYQALPRSIHYVNKDEMITDRMSMTQIGKVQTKLPQNSTR